MIEMPTKTQKIAIIGGGPAGAYLAYLLAKKGIKPTIYDNSHPREKPCGGGITTCAVEKFSFLHDLPGEKIPEYEMELTSPQENTVLVKGNKKSWNLSRKILDKSILDKATKQGAKLIKERVIDITLKQNIWHIKTNKKKYKAKIIVGADGVSSLTRRRILKPLSKRDLGVCYGCFAKSKENEITRIIFLDNMQGYGWCFPRNDHLSIGVGVEYRNSKKVKKIFQEFLNKYYPDAEIISNWGAAVPNVKNHKFFKKQCSGKNWILIGDAAGHVNPLNGEGITFALWSAEIAATAIINNDLESYDQLWRNEYGKHLITGSKMRSLFYNPLLLEYSLKIASRSKTFSKFLYDVINSQQKYNHISKRIFDEFPYIFVEFLLNKKN